MRGPSQRIAPCDRLRYQIASAEALPQMAALGIVSGLLTGILVLLFRGYEPIPLELILPLHQSENFEDLPVFARIAVAGGGAILLGMLLNRLRPRDQVAGVAAGFSATASPLDDIRARTLAEIPLVALERIVVAVCAAAFMQIVKRVRSLATLPAWSRIALAGAITAAVAGIIPEVMGIEYDTVERTSENKIELGACSGSPSRNC